MCNSYRITPRRGADKGVRAKVAVVAKELASPLVRKSDPGVVVLADGRVAVMRWGFHRSFNPAINNARSDKLATGMWAEAFRTRRCLLPMSLFYEWGLGTGGQKQAHEFHDPADDYLWVAGLWEDHPEFGPCYSMVTTAASAVMAPIHHRMPAMLASEDTEGYLSGVAWPFRPYPGPLAVAACASPLLKVRDDGGQPELPW